MIRVLYISLFLFLSLISFAQSPQIRISEEKINQNGIIKYVHTVKKGETLYSLSKAYNVPQDIIINDNPALKNGLKDGMIIFIPSNSTPIQEVSVPAVTKTDLKNKKNYKKHTAKWYETIDDIAKKYNVTSQSIVELNSLKSTTLQKRQVLLIPDNEFVNSLTQVEEDNNTIDNSLTNHIDTISTTEVDISATIKRDIRNDVIDITYLLPINGLDSANINHNFMDFYAGSLLALKKLKNDGIKINVNLIDQFNFPISDVINLNKLQNTELIIGPIKKNDIEDLIRFTKGMNIPIVSPMDQTVETLLDSNNVLIQAPSVSKAQINNIVTLLKKDYLPHSDSSKIILIYENGHQDYNIIEQAKNELNNRGLKYEELTYTVLEGRNMLNKISESFTLNGNNYVIVPSTNAAFVDDVIRNVSLAYNNSQETINMQIYGLSRWRNFETIEPENFHKLGLNLSIPYFVDYSNQNIKEFLLTYRALFNNEPTPYSFQGYDITTYFVNILKEYGKDFIKLNSLPEAQLFQSNVSYNKENSNSGFSNSATRDINYKRDFTIKVK